MADPAHQPRPRGHWQSFPQRRPRRERVGYEFAHSIIDDHSRLAYTELHPDERGPTVVSIMERAIVFLCSYGIEPRRLQSDIVWTYTKNRALAELLESARGSPHRAIPRGCRSETGRWSATSRRTNASGVCLLAPPLQPHSTPQLDRQLPVCQSRSGRLEGRQLASPHGQTDLTSPY
jgi:hypothetical protein